MIGTQTIADLLASATIVEDEDGFPIFSRCSGLEAFSWLGSGSERHAFLGPDNVVYKRTLSEPKARYSNAQEWDNFNRVTLPNNVRFAECYLWFSGDVDVLAMEFIDGVGEGELFWDHESHKALVQQGWTDLHEHNCSILDGVLILIDFAR